MTEYDDLSWIPTPEEVQEEMHRVRTGGRFRQTLKSTSGTVLVVAAIAVLIAALFLPVLQVTGNSMEPTFKPGDILVTYKTKSYDPGEVCAFYYNNKLIVKRVIALGGDTVDISEDGVVTVNGRELSEPYLKSTALGPCDLEFPFDVPLGQMFVMGDNRATSVDSRSSEFGCLSSEEAIGKVFLRVWPVNGFAFYGF